MTQKISCSKGFIAQIKADYIGLIAESDPIDRKLKLKVGNEVPPWATGNEDDRKFGFNYCGQTKWLEQDLNCDEFINKEKYVEAFNAQCHKNGTLSECDFALRAKGKMPATFKGTPKTDAEKKQ